MNSSSDDHGTGRTLLHPRGNIAQAPFQVLRHRVRMGGGERRAAYLLVEPTHRSSDFDGPDVLGSSMCRAKSIFDGAAEASWS